MLLPCFLVSDVTTMQANSGKKKKGHQNTDLQIYSCSFKNMV